MLNSIFDSLGYLTPITLRLKLILKKLCKPRLDWNDAVPVEVANEWNAFLTDAVNLSKFVIDRCFNPTDFGLVTHTSLHHLCVASESGTAADKSQQ